MEKILWVVTWNCSVPFEPVVLTPIPLFSDDAQTLLSTGVTNGDILRVVGNARRIETRRLTRTQFQCIIV